MDLKAEIELMERLIALTKDWKDLMERCAEIQRGMVPQPQIVPVFQPYPHMPGFPPFVVTCGDTNPNTTSGN